MNQRRYVPTTLPRLASEHQGPGPAVSDAIEAADDSEQEEYAALMAAADASAEMVLDLPDGARRRVVVVLEAGTGAQPVWSDVVAVHVDSDDDADPDEDLGWWATQEIADLTTSVHGRDHLPPDSDQ